MDIRCPNCNRKLKVKEEALGRRARCPSCQHVFTIESPSEEPAAEGASPQEPSEAPKPEEARPEDILQAYKESAKREPAGIGGKLRGLFRKARSGARTVRLKREVGKLRAALDDQMEKLGLLAVQHRPGELDLDADLQELRNVQHEISEQEATLESLRETGGSGSVVKDLKGELSELRQRERNIMVGIGRKAEAARPDMPGAAGHYSAIARLRSTLETRRSELAQLDEAAGQVPSEPGSEGRFPTRKLLPSGVVAAVVLGVLITVGLLSLLLFFFTRESYEVVHQVVGRGRGSVYMEVEVAGKAADLAVLLTEPGGKTETETIGAVEMMDNTETVRLNMLHDYQTIMPGTYTLVLKTIEPERVVHKERVELTEGNAAIQAVEFKLKPWYHGKQMIQQVELTVQNSGDLPVLFGDLTIDLGDVVCTGRVRAVGLPGEHTVKCATLSSRPKKVEEYVPGSLRLPDISGSLKPGSYLARGKLELAGKEGQFTTFGKTLNVPRSQY